MTEKHYINSVKYILVNTVTVSFYTIVGQMAKMSQRKKQDEGVRKRVSIISKAHV